MSELIDNRAHRISVLKEIVHLHAGWRFHGGRYRAGVPVPRSAGESTGQAHLV
jgi:hypothetical protein